jgi:hypothetical protein
MIWIFLALLFTCLPAYAQETTSAEGVLMLDATFVPCGDSTETLLVFRDGRAVYAYMDQGVMFPLGSTVTADLGAVVDRAVSTVETKGLDSCTTVGVILSGPRYLLINSRRPSPETKELQSRLEQIRKYARRKLPMIERLRNKAGETSDTTIDSEPWVASDELLENVAPSPIAREWRCRGSVQVAVNVDRSGKARQIYVERAAVKGKCSSLLTATAIRAVMESDFTPAVKLNGRNTAGWMQVEVTFGGRKGK